MSTNYSSIDNALKRDYLPVLQKQIEKKVKTWDLFSKSTEGIKGRDLYIKMFTDYPQGVGPADAEATLPTPGNAGYIESKVSVKRNYAVVQFDAMIKEERNAIVDLIDFEMETAEESLQKELNFQLAYGDGSGTRGFVNAAVNDANQVVVNLTAIDGRPGVDFLYKNMYIDIKKADGTAEASAKKITAVDPATNTITLDGNVTVSKDSIIYRAGARNLCMMGLPGIVSDAGVLQGVDPATNSCWKSHKTDKSAKWGASDADFLDSIQEMIDKVQYNSNGKTNLIYAWPLFQRQYRFAMEAKRRIVNTLDFKEGRKGLAYVTEDGEVAIMADSYLPWYKVFFLDTDKLSLRTLKGLHWEEEGGSILRFLERKDVFTAWLKLYSEFVTTSRNTHGFWYNTGTTVGDYTT